MNKRFNFFISLFLISAFFSAGVLAQELNEDYEPTEERSSFEQRKKSIMTGNNMRATYHNFGHGGRSDPNNIDELLFEFPANTNREYMFFMMVQMGTLVEDQTDPGNFFPIVDVGTFKTNRSGTENWSLNPVRGYSRSESQEIARSDRGPGSPLGNTWPDVWPNRLVDGGDGWAGSWNGFFGRDQFNADVEFYYRAGDDLYTRFSSTGRFQPDITDPTRGGIGMLMDTRILAWSQTLIADVHFNIFEVINDASYNYDQVAFGLWIADFVAGNGNDDPEFDDLLSVAYLKEEDRLPSPPAFDGLPIGEMAVQFLETPGNATDGIDNDGDSNTYDITDPRYDSDNNNLYDFLFASNGGFFDPVTLRDTVIKEFEAADFDQRVITPGDKIVLIQDDLSRVVTTYDGSPFVSQGRTWDFDGGNIVVTEDLLDVTNPNFGVHIDGLDNDFDGLIDENNQNHLEKFIPGEPAPIAVRFINYLYYQPGDTLQNGLIVPNQQIRNRMGQDENFQELVNDFHEGRFRNRFTAAPMIDEDRDDLFDNDQDWVAISDDVGIEGDPDSPSEGQGDGKPTSGAETPFPGEPAIDKTDVTETDLLGVTRATIFDAGQLQVNLDSDIWNSRLVPGEFNREGSGNDSDIYVSSGLFPMDAGEIQRFAVAVAAVQPPSVSTTAEQDRAALNSKLEDAFEAYESDYQFARAPTPPVLEVVEGDGKITLYWDDSSEESFDRFVDRITGNGNDFQGYRIYKATDPSFEDVKTITDAFGTPIFFNPIRIFDLQDGISGLSPVPINGVQFNLGDDTGLQYSFEDTDVINGKRYYYAVTAFDAGIDFAGIAPSESPIQISQNPDGSFIFGQNVALARPTRLQAGFIDPDNPDPNIITGSPGGSVEIDVIDRDAIREDNTYAVTFEDTLIQAPGSTPDTLRTKNFTLANITSGQPDTLIANSQNFNGERNPITEGFEIILRNVNELRLDTERSRWVAEGEDRHRFDFAVWRKGVPKVADYEIVIGDNVGFGRSTERTVEASIGNFVTLEEVDTNFKVFNTFDGQEVDYAFADLHQNSSQGAPPGIFSATSGFTGLQTDVIIFIEDERGVQDTTTYRLQLNPLTEEGQVTSINPQPGDTLQVFTTKPFSSSDRFEFTMTGESKPTVDPDSARRALEDVLVIPNPYKVSSGFEQAPANPNDRQQRRELHFTGMPAPSTLRIFTIAGVMIDEIEIEQGDLLGGQFGGTYVWDMLTKDDLEIAYGIYLYHIEARGVGETTGKFAVIK